MLENKISIKPSNYYTHITSQDYYIIQLLAQFAKYCSTLARLVIYESLNFHIFFNLFFHINNPSCTILHVADNVECHLDHQWTNFMYGPLKKTPNWYQVKYDMTMGFMAACLRYPFLMLGFFSFFLKWINARIFIFIYLPN